MTGVMIDLKHVAHLGMLCYVVMLRLREEILGHISARMKLGSNDFSIWSFTNAPLASPDSMSTQPKREQNLSQNCFPLQGGSRFSCQH